MSTYPMIAITVAVLLVLFLVVFISKRRQGEKMETNYRVLFVLGLIWLPIGIATDNPGLWSIGLVFFIVGLVNRDKWHKEKG